MQQHENHFHQSRDAVIDDIAMNHCLRLVRVLSNNKDPVPIRDCPGMRSCASDWLRGDPTIAVVTGPGRLYRSDIVSLTPIQPGNGQVSCCMSCNGVGEKHNTITPLFRKVSLT